ncbi:MAG: Transcriptional regulatory protein ZraR [Bacteroidetes bacterium ADurb.Bin397]|jgi:transcriptional regulator with PAS, ATPase and Fis domain|nr:MAG: Transcriptional regulatory protein ZraR [Bacteroidetes bacterium ADurb.Bin397]
MNIQDIKQRFGIIGHSPLLDHAIDTARQVAPTDITVLITGESGTGKEVFPQIIHQLSARKHGPYIAVNCGAIPEGTIDSELFGHEKGAFTGAHEARKGYFEVVNGGTIFLDEVAELPLLTQVRLLRVLESGEFLKVGSSKSLKTDVRVVAATNVNLPEAIHNNKFREDLYYRLNTVPIQVPALRQRKEDIHLLFRKFANDFAERYKMPTVVLQPDAMQLLSDYRWPGNVRQLKNVTEQLSILERQKNINAEILMKYIPQDTGSRLPVLVKEENKGGDFSERELLYKVLFEMKKDIVDLKKLVVELISEGNVPGSIHENNSQIIDKLYQEFSPGISVSQPQAISIQQVSDSPHEELAEELLSLEEKEKEIIKRAIEKHRGKRKYAAKELGISERTLYRKIKEYDIK